MSTEATNTLQLLWADWPDGLIPGVRACVTTRIGGVSVGVFAAGNLALHVGDDPAAVLQNRAQLQRQLFPLFPLFQRPLKQPPEEQPEQQLLQPGSSIQWLDQTHGIEVVDACADGVTRAGDAVYSDQAGVAGAVLTADCLPVFFAAKNGREVAVAHAGWRGLLAGVLEQTVQRFSLSACDLAVWLGPAIGPSAFEVGAEVRDLFVAESSDFAAAFTKKTTSHAIQQQASTHWFANLYQLAHQRLTRAGVVSISGGDFCTYTDAARFYSYRRDGPTGRMASMIWFEDAL